MKKIILLLALLLSVTGFAQNASINDYKYVIMPDYFDFLKEKDQFSLNTLTKKIFENKGFQVFYANDNNMPIDLKLDNCKALYGNLVLNSGLMSTGLTIVLKDCAGKAVFTSLEGKSKEKEYKKAYYEALREASRSLDIVSYEYKEDGAAKAQSLSVPARIEKQKAAENQLFAKPTASGYELLDSSQKVVLKMFKTSQPDSYSAQMEGISGVVFKKGDSWVFEYYVDDKPISQKLNIKF